MTKRGFGCGVVLGLVCCLVCCLGGSVAAQAAAPEGQHGGSGHGTPGYLGIDCRDVSDDQVSSLKLKDNHGAEIVRVDHDGPAGKMGLREHDVVLQMNGAAISGRDQVSRLLREMPAGRSVALVISRDGQQITLTAQMANRTDVEREAWEQHLTAPPPLSGPQGPSSAGYSGDASAQTVSVAAPAPAPKYSKGFLGTILLSPAYTGVMLERIGPQLEQFFGVPRGTGLLVKSVDNNSPAAAAGVRAGDVVVRANTRLISSMTDWARVVRDAKGKAIAVVVLRDRQEQTLQLTPDARKHS